MADGSGSEKLTSEQKKWVGGDPEYWWLTLIPAGALVAWAVFGASMVVGVWSAGGNVGWPGAGDTLGAFWKVMTGWGLDDAWLVSTDAGAIATETWLWLWAALFAVALGAVVLAGLEWRAAEWELPKWSEMGSKRAKGKFGPPPKEYWFSKWPFLGPYSHQAPSPGVLLGRHGRRNIAAGDGLPVIVLGPTGAGKTRGVIAPNSAQWPGPVAATSVKTDLIDLTLPVRSRKGRVWGFEPSGRLYQDMVDKGITPVVWDPLRLLREGLTSGTPADWRVMLKMAEEADAAGEAGWAQKYRRDAAERRAPALKEDADLLGQFLASQSSAHGQGSQAVWAAHTRSAISDALLIGAMAERSLADVLEWLSSLSTFADTVYEALAPLAPRWGEEATAALKRLGGKGGMDSKLSGSIDVSVGEVVEALEWTSRRPDLDLLPVGLPLGPPADRAGQHDTLYLVADHLSQNTHNSLFAATLRHLFHVTETGDMGPDTPLFALDELANLAPLPDWPNIISTIRSKGQVITGVQEVSQMADNWGDKAAITIIGNHPTKVLLGGTADASAAQGWMTLAVPRDGGEDEDEDKVSAADFRTIPSGQAVVLASNIEPFDVRLTDPDPWLKIDAKIEPIAPPKPQPDRPGEPGGGTGGAGGGGGSGGGDGGPAMGIEAPGEDSAALDPRVEQEAAGRRAKIESRLDELMPVASADTETGGPTSDGAPRMMLELDGTDDLEAIEEWEEFMLGADDERSGDSAPGEDDLWDEGMAPPTERPAAPAVGGRPPERTLRPMGPPQTAASDPPADQARPAVGGRPPQRPLGSTAPPSTGQARPAVGGRPPERTLRPMGPPQTAAEPPAAATPPADQPQVDGGGWQSWALTTPGDSEHVSVTPEMVARINWGQFSGDGWAAHRDALGDWAVSRAGFAVAPAMATAFEDVLPAAAAGGPQAVEEMRDHLRGTMEETLG